MASIESDAIEIGPSPLKKQKTEIHYDHRTDGGEDAEMDDNQDPKKPKDEDAEIDGDEITQNGGENDSEVDSVIDFEGDVHGKTPRHYHVFDPESDVMIKEYVRYHYEWQKSEGFEVDWSKVTYRFSALPVVWKDIVLLTDERGDKLIKRLTLFAIDKHNQEEGKKLELVKILKANFHLARGHVFYITFCAKELSSSNPDPILYQTKVWTFVDEITVMFLRRRPTDEEIASVQVVPPPPLTFDDKPPVLYAEPPDLFGRDCGVRLKAEDDIV